MKKPKKVRMGMLGARTATKVQEKDILARLQALAEHPEYILPRCIDKHSCPFSGYKKDLARINKNKDNQEYLKKASLKGKDLPRAYAAALYIANEGKISMMAHAKLPVGEANYIMRPKIKKEVLIGTQNYNDPVLKLFGFRQDAQKKGIYVFATDKETICTGKDPKAPEEFVRDLPGSIDYPVVYKDGIIHCKHLDSVAIKKGGEGHIYLQVKWPGVNVAVCDSCVKEKNLLAMVLGRIAAKKPLKTVQVEVVMDLKDEVKDGTCGKGAKGTSSLVQQYLKGMLDDASLVSKSKLVFFQGMDAYMIGTRCFGSKVEKFMNALEPDALEREALELLLVETGPIQVSPSTTPSQILSEHWKDHGLTILTQIMDSEEKAKSLLKEFRTANAAQILREAKAKMKGQAILADLPDFSRPGPVLEFADDVAKAFRTGGKGEAVRAVDRYKGGNTKVKSVGYAYLVSLNQQKGKEYQFNNTERDFGTFLSQFTTKLLNDPADKYEEHMKTLLDASGSGEEI